jgi:hypothetical protein
MIKLPQNLLVPFPPTRINDVFVGEGSEIDFSTNKFNRDPIIQGEPNSPNTRFFAEFYKKIGVDIVCETVFDYPYPFFTEKTYRSIACLRPFIIVGPYGILEFIKSLNFQTFSAIIDESYDQIQDSEKRFVSVCNSINQFVARPIDQIKKDIVSVEMILLHNHTVLQRLVETELTRFKSQLKI